MNGRAGEYARDERYVTWGSHAGHSRHRVQRGSASKRVTRGGHLDNEFVAYARKTLVSVGSDRFERLACNRFELAGRCGCEGFDVLSPENPHTKRVTGYQQHQNQHQKNNDADDDALSVAVQVCDSRHSYFSLLLTGAYETEWYI